MPVPTLAQQCATYPTLRTGGMQDIREPMRAITRKICPCKQRGLELVILEIAIPTFPTQTRHHDFPAPTFKTQQFFGSSPNFHAALCLKFFDLVIQFTHGIHSLQMGPIIHSIKNPP